MGLNNKIKHHAIFFNCFCNYFRYITEKKSNDILINIPQTTLYICVNDLIFCMNGNYFWKVLPFYFFHFNNNKLRVLNSIILDKHVVLKQLLMRPFYLSLREKS